MMTKDRWLRIVFRKIFESGLEQYYKEGLGAIMLATVLFAIYKSADVLIAINVMPPGEGHFGYLVERYPVLQWFFQAAAFLGCGMAFFFFLSLKNAMVKISEKNGALEQVRNLTEELAAMDKAIREERDRYHLILNRQKEMIVKFEVDGRVTFANYAMYSFFGYKHWDEMVGKNIYDLVQMSYPDLEERLADLTPENNQEKHIETMVSYDSKIAYVEWVNTALFDENEKIKTYQSVGRDVTDIIEANKKLRFSEQRYRMLFVHNLAGYAVHAIVCDDPGINSGAVCDYVFVEVNPAFEEMFGFTAEEIIGSTILSIMPSTEPSLITRFGMVARSGVPDLFECYFSDIKKWFSVAAFRPEENHFAATFFDITKFKSRTGKKERSGDKKN